MARILVFGDSITCGDNDPKGGWVHYLRKHYYFNRREKDGYTFYNLGVSGDTSRSILGRIENEIESRLWYYPDGSYEKMIVILEIGVNDSAYVINNKLNWITPEQFSSNITKIIEIARHRASQIVLVGPAPVKDDMINPIYWAPHLSYQNPDVMKYSEILRKAATEGDLPFIDLYSMLNNEDWYKCIPDGVHPNTKGHEMIFQIVKRELEKEGII